MDLQRERDRDEQIRDCGEGEGKQGRGCSIQDSRGSLETAAAAATGVTESSSGERAGWGQRFRQREARGRSGQTLCCEEEDCEYHGFDWWGRVVPW
jgi:hypothetical protein